VLRRTRPLLLLAALVASSCGQKRLPLVDGADRDLLAGRMIYERKCASCHGEDGEGKTITASRFKYANLVDGVWRSDGSPAALERQIRQGHDPMPRFEGKLTDEEIRQTAAFVLELARVARRAAPAEAGKR
jgi:mono/diheme cytochrome c family protein